MNETTTTYRWVADKNGRTVYHDIDDFYDALFALGITNPGASGSVTQEDGSVVQWGEHTEQQLDDWANIFGASAGIWSWWRDIQHVTGDWDTPGTVRLVIENPVGGDEDIDETYSANDVLWALGAAAAKYPHLFHRDPLGYLDLDASSADVVLQVLIFGEAVYG